MLKVKLPGVQIVQVSIRAERSLDNLGFLRIGRMGRTRNFNIRPDPGSTGKWIYGFIYPERRATFKLQDFIKEYQVNIEIC